MNMTDQRAKYDAGQIKMMIARGEAMPDGAYPIADRADLEAAVSALSDSGSDGQRQHAIARARALGLSDVIPDAWTNDGRVSMTGRGASRGLEERSFAVNEVELRGEGTTAPVLHGYASTFNQPYSVHVRGFSFSETILPGAWTHSLDQRGDKVHLLVAHGGIPLAASHSGTLRLGQDSHGLEYDAHLDGNNPLAQQVISAVQRGDMDEMSVGMRIPKTGDNWSDDGTERFISEASLVEISVLPRGANPGTVAGMRDDQLLAEVRARGLDLTDATTNVGIVVPAPEPVADLTAELARLAKRRYI